MLYFWAKFGARGEPGAKFGEAWSPLHTTRDQPDLDQGDEKYHLDMHQVGAR